MGAPATDPQRPDDVSLKAARIKAMENYLVADRGDDPFELQRRQVRRVPTFAKLVEEFIEYRRRRWSNPRAERRWRRSLEIHAYPALRHRLVSEIRARDVADVLNRLHRSSPKSVPRVRQQICAVLSCAQALEYLSHAPWRARVRRRARWPCVALPR